MAFTVTNNLDDVAIYIGLTRLPGETDEAFTSRIKRFANIRYGIDTRTSVRSIMEQVGLKMTPAAKITCSKPYSFTISQDYITLESFGASAEYVRIFIHDINNIPDKVYERVLATNGFNIEILDADAWSNLGKETLFRNSNIKIEQEAVSRKRTIFKTSRMLDGTFKSTSPYITTKKDSPQDIRRIGDYYIDYEINYLEIYNDPTDVFGVTYTSYEEYSILYRTEFNLIPISNYSKYGISDNYISILDSYLKGRSLGPA